MPKNLVFSLVTEGSAYTTWSSAEKNYDLIIVYGGENKAKIKKLKEKSTYFYNESFSSKLIALKTLMERDSNIFKQYEYIWVPDDTVECSYKDINNLFKIMKDYGLWLSQPSIENPQYHKQTKTVENSILRYTNFVEVVAPCFYSKKLKTISDSFFESTSMWGLDYLWVAMLKKPKDKIAIVDFCIAKNSLNGVEKNNIVINPVASTELKNIKRKYKDIFDKYKNFEKIEIFSSITKEGE